MVFEKATAADIDEIMELIRAAQHCIAELGIDQWQDGYPTREIIEADIAAGYGCVLRQRGVIVAYAAIIFDNEPTYDVIYEGKWLSAGRYCVVHRVAVLSSFRGNGAAGVMFGEALKQCRERGTPALRIDTHEGNLPMQHAAQKFGFTRCGIILLNNGDRRIGYELMC